MHYYLVSYDIKDAKRLKKVFKLMKNFGHSVQYSVFICHLNSENLEIMKSKLISVIEEKEDQVMFVQLRENSSGGIQKKTLSFIGKPVDAETPDCWIFP